MTSAHSERSPRIEHRHGRARYWAVMANDRIQLVQAVLDGLSRGDLDAAFRDLAPDAELDMSRALGLARGVYKGAEIREVVAEFNSGWASIEYGADEFIEAGDDILFPFTNRLHGRDGIELQARGAWLMTVRDGLIVRACLYQERDEALAAMGLR